MKLVNRIIFQLFLGSCPFLVKGYPLAKAIRRDDQVINIFLFFLL